MKRGGYLEELFRGLETEERSALMHSPRDSRERVLFGCSGVRKDGKRDRAKRGVCLCPAGEGKVPRASVFGVFFPPPERKREIAGRMGRACASETRVFDADRRSDTAGWPVTGAACPMEGNGHACSVRREQVLHEEEDAVSAVRGRNSAVRRE